MWYPLPIFFMFPWLKKYLHVISTYFGLVLKLMIISHIGVNTVYYETCDLLSSNKLFIYDKEKRDYVKVIILYKFAMDLNRFLFDPTEPKICHSRVIQAQVAST